MIVFDLTNKKTLQNAKTWIDELNENASLDILIALIGNKADMESERQMTYEVRKSLNRKEGKKFADEHGLLYYECSAKTGENVKEMFVDVMNKIPRSEANESAIMDIDPFAKDPKNKNTGRRGMCC